MGLLNKEVGAQFNLRDIGILDGPPLRGADIVVRTARDLFPATKAAFAVFDETASEVTIQSASPHGHGIRPFSLENSALGALRRGKASVIHEDLGSSWSEAAGLNAASLIGAAVKGPDQRVIGALAVWASDKRIWPLMSSEKLEGLSYLISQEVALWASFATLRIISTERRRSRH